jgi:hypothetical protein
MSSALALINDAAEILENGTAPVTGDTEDDPGGKNSNYFGSNDTITTAVSCSDICNITTQAFCRNFLFGLK